MPAVELIVLAVVGVGFFALIVWVNFYGIDDSVDYPEDDAQDD